MTDIRTLHREVDIDFADEGGIAPLEDDYENVPNRHRFGGEPAERKYPLWPVVLGLVVFWTAVILTVRSCA